MFETQENHPLWTADGQLRPGWRFVAFAVLAMGMDLLVQMAFGVFRPNGPLTLLMSEWPGALAMALVGLLMVRLDGNRGSRGIGETLGLNGRPKGWLRMGQGFLLGGAIMLATAGLLWMLGMVHWHRTPMAGWRDLLMGLWLYISVGFYEELMFRGYAFSRLREGLGDGRALAVSALLFALAHWQNPGMEGGTALMALINIALAGVLLGICVLRSGDLMVAIGVHVGWNWIQGSILGFGVSGTSDTRGWLEPAFGPAPRWLTGGSFGLEASVLCAATVVVACLLMTRRSGASEVQDLDVNDARATASEAEA